MGEIINITIERPGSGGQFVAHHQEKVVLIPYVLPGELVEAEIVSVKPDFLTARPVRIIQAHEARRAPDCSLYTLCGGCQLMHAEYDVQLQMKLQTLPRRIMEFANSEGGKIENARSPHTLFYRDRVRFQIAGTGNGLKLGFFEAGTGNLVPVRFCFQVHSKINDILPALTAWVAAMPDNVEAPTELEVLRGEPGEGFSLILDLPKSPEAKLKDIIKAGPEIFDKTVIRYKVKGKILLKGKGGIEQSLTWLKKDDSLPRLVALPAAFTQINKAVNRLMILEAMEFAKSVKPKFILDVFCGLGNFSLPLSAVCRQVTGVDFSLPAYISALLNRNLNKISNVEFINQKAGPALDDLAKSGKTFDLVILDPPRAGAKGLAIKLSLLKPRDILYFSCHPASMSRDLIEFMSLGYSIKRVKTFDMFPQTSHLEVMVHLSAS